MKVFSHRLTVPVLLVLLSALAFYLVVLIGKINNDELEARAVWNLTADFDRMRNQLVKIPVGSEIDYLTTLNHVTFHCRNPYLNLIANNLTQQMARDVIRDLRIKTGTDLGEKPDVWISKYGYNSNKVDFNKLP